MGCKQSKKRCKICSTVNKNKKEHLCEECQFIPNYITKFGRENLKRIIHSSFQEYEKPIIDDQETKKKRSKSFRKNINSVLTLNEPMPTAPSPPEAIYHEESYMQTHCCKSKNCSCHERHFSPPSYPSYNA
jgi:hypothetical protein